MNAVAKQYDITPERASNTPLRVRLSMFVFVFSAMLVLEWLFAAIFHLFSNGTDLVTADRMLNLILMATVFALLPGKTEMSLTIGEDFVERRIYFGIFSIRRRISRLQANSVEEIKLYNRGDGFATTGLAVRDRGRIGTRLFGYVFVPDSIPKQDYEEAKARLMLWNRPLTSVERVMAP